MVGRRRVKRVNGETVKRSALATRNQRFRDVRSLRQHEQAEGGHRFQVETLKDKADNERWIRKRC